MRPTALGEIETSAQEDTDRFARMTPAQRLAVFFELFDLTDAIQAGRPNRDALRAGQPRSAEATALWATLMSRARGG